MAEELPTVTLLVCTSGRPQLLHRLLTAMSSGRRKPEQVVVVNGVVAGAPDRTASIVEEHAAEFERVVLLEHPNRNLATLRNIGIPHCREQIIAFTDDDAVPDDDWILSIARAHASHPGPAAVGGAVRGLRPDSLVSRIADQVVFPSPVPGRPVHTLPTVNMSYSRILVGTVGNFDVTLFRGEDVDFNWRARLAGVRIHFDPSIRVRHEHRPSVLALYRQQYMYGRAYVLVRRKWPDMYAVYPRHLRTARDWAKLFHAGLAVLYQPLLVARAMPLRRDRVLAYPILVGHHAVWKLGMLRQGLKDFRTRPDSFDGPAIALPKIQVWEHGRAVHNDIPRGQTHPLP